MILFRRRLLFMTGIMIALYFMLFTFFKSNEALALDPKKMFGKEGDSKSKSEGNPKNVINLKERPNIVLIFMDNFGWGELGVYGGGILRGAPTPRVDKLASEGMRLLNFNVEAQSSPSRAAIMTGRYAVRTGNAAIPIDTPLYGLTQWEYTMAEMFSDAGYATGMFGKWHLGHTEGRFPTDQGFDEWYGIPNSSDESFWPDDPRYRPDSHPFAHPEYIMESRKGTKPKKLRVYDLKERALIDKELTDKSIDFMKRVVW